MRKDMLLRVGVISMALGGVQIHGNKIVTIQIIGIHLVRPIVIQMKLILKKLQILTCVIVKRIITIMIVMVVALSVQLVVVTTTAEIKEEAAKEVAVTHLKRMILVPE